MLAPALFLDRDGTINADVGFLSDPAGLVVLAGAASGIRAFNQAGWRVIVVTNQSGIGRGYYDETALDAIHRRLIAELAADGARLDALYFCPHHPETGCRCRKPATGMVERAQREHDLDLSRSWVIGDRSSDLELGRRAGCRTALVRPPVPVSGGEEAEGLADLVVRDLVEAAALILEMPAGISIGRGGDR